MVNSRWAFTPREVYATDLVLNPNGEGGPLAHLLHTSGTPLAHLWHTSGTPLACLACTPGGSPRLPPEKNSQTPQRDHHLPQPEEKIHIQGETLPPP